jgi:arsenate reductase
MEKLKVAYICVHNSCRSQMAEAITKILASDVIDCWSGGTETKEKIDPGAVSIIKKLYGIDMEETQRSKLLTEIPPVDMVVTMGCNVACPAMAAETKDDWGLDDPTGKSAAEYEKTARIIEAKVRELRARIIDSRE